MNIIVITLLIFTERLEAGEISRDPLPFFGIIRILRVKDFKPRSRNEYVTRVSLKVRTRSLFLSLSLFLCLSFSLFRYRSHFLFCTECRTAIRFARDIEKRRKRRHVARTRVAIRWRRKNLPSRSD